MCNEANSNKFRENSSKLQLKTNYAVKQQWEPFYTGGTVDISQDGSYLFCKCGEKVQVLNINSGIVEKVLEHHDGDVCCFKLSPCDEFVITSTSSLLLKQWTWKDVKCIRTWKAIHTSPIISMDFDSTSTLLASGGSDGTIKVWDLINQYCTHNFKDSQGVVNIVKFHPTQLTLYSSSSDYLVKVWNLQTSKCLAQLECHNSAVTCIEFPSDKTVITGGRDNIVAIWSVPQKPTATNIEPSDVIPIFKTVEDIAIVPVDKLPSHVVEKIELIDSDIIFVTCGSEGILRLWSSKSRKCLLSSESSLPSTSTQNYIYSKILHDFNQIMCVTDDQRFDFFNISDFKLEKHLVGYNDDILDIKMLGKDESHIVVATNSPNIKVFDIASASCQVLHGHTGNVLCIDVFPNKVSFVSSSKDNALILWALLPNSFTVQQLCKVEGHTHAVSAVSTSKISNSIFASGSEDCTIKVWTIKKTKKEGVVANIRFTSLAHQKIINCVTISPNDKFLATGSLDKTAKLWDIANGKQIVTFNGHRRGIWCVQFSPTDQVLATSSGDSTVKLWSLSDGSCLKTLEGHDSSVLKLVFIAKGTQIVTSGSDGLLKLWTVKTSECVQTMDKHDEKVWALCSSKNDQILFSGSADSVIVAWEDVTEKLKQESAEAQQTVMLQHQELQNLLQEKRFIKALLLAIKLNQPFTALNVIKELMWEDDGVETLKMSIGSLRLDQKQSLFKFVVSWNTNSRNCHEAQAVLHALILSTPPNEIEDFNDAQSTIESLLPYTDRHFHRLSRIAQQSTFLDYTWCIMKMAPMNMN